MDFIKKNEEVTQISSYEHVIDNLLYEATVVKVNDALRNVNINAKRIVENGSEHLGQMSMQNGHKSVSFTVGESIATHVAVFESFLTYIEGGEIDEPVE